MKQIRGRLRAGLEPLCGDTVIAEVHHHVVLRPISNGITMTHAATRSALHSGNGVRV